MNKFKLKAETSKKTPERKAITTDLIKSDSLTFSPNDPINPATTSSNTRHMKKDLNQLEPVDIFEVPIQAEQCTSEELRQIFP